MIIVTGGAGFIGSNIIRGLNKRGYSDILLVDNLLNGKKILNINDLNINDIILRDDFINRLTNGNDFNQVTAIFHLGACSSTTEWDGNYLIRNNFEYSKALFSWCSLKGVPFIYASSASVYGLAKEGFSENSFCEKPINAYAYSKYLFDHFIRKFHDKKSCQVVGLRYFNVYGPGECHKKNMTSPVFNFYQQLEDHGECKIFKGSHGVDDGEHKRDFVYVEDCADVNIWFLENREQSGIYNVGTGEARTFNDVANNVLTWKYGKANHSSRIKYVEFPKNLLGSYQSHTAADLENLRKAGCEIVFRRIEEGIPQYLNQLNN